MHAHTAEPILSGLPVDVVGFALFAILIYLFMALLFGCPYCLMPDMKWPATLVKGIAREVR